MVCEQSSNRHKGPGASSWWKNPKLWGQTCLRSREANKRGSEMVWNGKFLCLFVEPTTSLSSWRTRGFSQGAAAAEGRGAQRLVSLLKRRHNSQKFTGSRTGKVAKQPRKTQNKKMWRRLSAATVNERPRRCKSHWDLFPGSSGFLTSHVARFPNLIHF